MFVDVIAAVLIVCLCYVRKIILKVKKDYYEKGDIINIILAVLAIGLVL